jgi:hypothetical protein
MTEYPTPERVGEMMELRAYMIELGLNPKDVTEIATTEAVTIDGKRWRFTLADGSMVIDDGPHESLTDEQRIAGAGAARELEEIWAQLHETPAFRPKEWEPAPAAGGPCKVSEEALFTDLGPVGPRMSEVRVPNGALELTCTCGWHKIVPVDQADALIAEHEGATT